MRSQPKLPEVPAHCRDYWIARFEKMGTDFILGTIATGRLIADIAMSEGLPNLHLQQWLDEIPEKTMMAARRAGASALLYKVELALSSSPSLRRPKARSSLSSRCSGAPQCWHRQTGPSRRRWHRRSLEHQSADFDAINELRGAGASVIGDDGKIELVENVETDG